MRMILFGKPIESLPQAQELMSAFSSSEIESKRRASMEIELEKIIHVLGDVGKIFANPNSQCRRRALAELPVLLGYSEEMVKFGLDALVSMLGSRCLRERLACLPHPYCLDTPIHVSEGKVERAVPVGLVCHVAAGNVFLGSIDSLLYGIITKNVNVLKASRQDLVFPEIFFDALAEADTEGAILPFCSLLYWDRSEQQVERIFKEQSNLILIFGGAQALMAWRNGVGANTDVLAFGPKLSFGVVSAALSESELDVCARNFATDVALWEQRACTSCQNIFIENGANVEFFVNSLAARLKELSQEFPLGVKDLDERIELRKEREMIAWECFRSGGRVFEGECGEFAIFLKGSIDLVDSPLNRSVFVNCVSKLEDVALGNIRHMRQNLSTVGLAVGAAEESKICDIFARLGVLRFCRPGAMAASNDNKAPHDGVHLALALVRMVSFEGLSSVRHGNAFLPRPNNEALMLSRLQSALDNAKQAPFYKNHLKNVCHKLLSLQDYSQHVPVLEKQVLVEEGPEAGQSMITARQGSEYVFSAGGTTGAMKFVLYSAEEFVRSQKVWGEGFLCAGIETNDVVANCFRSGAFWTAFLATNGGLEQTGCRILSITGNQNELDTVRYLRKFSASVVVGVTSHLLMLAQESERSGLELCIPKLGYAGEHMSAEAKQYLRKVWRVQRFFSLGYAAVETGPIGFQCAHCDGTVHHVCENWVYLERDEHGDALVTTLERRVHPLIRFRVGDRIEWVDEPCPCGRLSPRFRLLERSDNVVMFHVSHLDVGILAQLLARFPELSPVFRVLVSHVEGSAELRVEIESAHHESEQLAMDVQDAILKNFDCVGLNARDNGIGKFQVVLLKLGGLERVERTGKVRRIVDGRL